MITAFILGLTPGNFFSHFVECYSLTPQIRVVFLNHFKCKLRFRKYAAKCVGLNINYADELFGF